MSAALRAPFPWYGAKRLVSSEVWQRLGNPPNYIEPFFGSGAVLLGRPDPPRTETVNDLDGAIANFWRSCAKDPETIANILTWPIVESDLHARNVWCLQELETMRPYLEGDPTYCRPDVAGWWLWGICLSIGNAWCGRHGPWWPDEEGRLVKHETERGVKRAKPALDGVRGAVGVWRAKPHLTGAQGILRRKSESLAWLEALQRRLLNVRVLSGDWSRCVTPSVTTRQGLTGAFFDPPYGVGDERVYSEGSQTVAQDVAAWCLEHGDDPMFRIALCGEASEHPKLVAAGWSVFRWSRSGGANRGGGRAEARHDERIWFSPHCLADQGYTELNLFGGGHAGS